MAISNSVWQLLLIGLVFHLVYIGTVFDCYFTSPVVRGMQQHSLKTAEAKRLVLIVGDGLRADLLLEKNGFPMVPGSPDVVAPHLRSIIEERGAWGISHTHVPTESRPGHVALIGGMYEDVSAVTKGWKTNPVDFDSVFNQSSATFSFGSPDILPMFARGATPGKVEMWCYDEEEEDFTKDATSLDVWVLDQLRALLHNATSDATLDARLRGEQTVFFLHLLGLDTTGHSYRPHSKEYMANIQVVDEIVKQTEELFREFFADDETAYVFTADHGMSKIGNHGDGDPDNTRTPIIAWGKGVRGPLPDSKPSSHDAYSVPFELSHLLRHDVEQADVAALMSSLIGVNWPINSVGVLPDVDPDRPGYLLPQEGEKTQAEAALINAKVILEHYRVKHFEKKEHSLYYRPYSYFVHSAQSDELPGDSAITAIEGLIRERRYHQARLQTKDFIAHSLEGLRYLQTYDRTMLQGIVIAAYLGWIAFGAVSILIPRSTPASSPGTSSLPVHIAAASVVAAFSAVFVKQRSPVTFYVYIAFPCYFWDQVLVRAGSPLLEYMRNSQPGSVGKILIRGAVVVAALQSMVAGYTHRSLWSAWFAILGVAWPLFWPSDVRSKNWSLVIGWTSCCLCTAIFPLLSVHQEENLAGITCGTLAMYAIGVLCSRWFKFTNSNESSLFKAAILIPLNNLGWSLILVAVIAWDLRDKKGVPPAFRFIGWGLFLSTVALPFVLRVGRSQPYARLLSFFLGFGVAFVWLAIAVEGLFYVAYSLTLTMWVEVETALRQATDEEKHEEKGAREDKSKVVDVAAYKPRVDDLRIAVFFLFFVQVAFFGTGNSFYLEPVYRLVPVFNPFLMAALLIFKIIAPYIILAICFSILNARLSLPPFSLFLVALTLTDIMTITFFLRVTDTGSWLEIGQTISFFCISSLLLVWSAGICALGEVLMAPSAEAQASVSSGHATVVKERTE
ncbi:alkaline phosphatase-like protein [Epithele typhae]|uniref:alkaline phosphatase-like protein n=1 Tax=Epithele typhae TaxID=378194 RepID=UPI0020072503|nr:alkaline phosphatase-like protein [Epithele typhae]KAH9925611.1 alkaline phosphatase-like protein [Epithele typhae]